jgi:hypothetical protein
VVKREQTGLQRAVPVTRPFLQTVKKELRLALPGEKTVDRFAVTVNSAALGLDFNVAWKVSASERPSTPCAAIAHSRDDAMALSLGGFALVAHDRDVAHQAFEAALALSPSCALMYILGS